MIQGKLTLQSGRENGSLWWLVMAPGDYQTPVPTRAGLCSAGASPVLGLITLYPVGTV
jgi:hypothetical protein